MATTTETARRQAHWQRVYADRSPLSVSWYQPAPLLSLELIRRSGVAAGDALIDVGGGTSLLVDYLLRAGFSDLTVLDISDAALAHARQRMGAEASTVEWIVADVTGFAAGRRFALWHDRAVFHFLTTPGERAQYVASLRRALQPGGHLVLAGFAVDGPDRCSGLPVQRHDSASLARELGADFVLQEKLGEYHRTPSGGLQKFSYYRFAFRPAPG